jgi:hypothetical protein
VVPTRTSWNCPGGFGRVHLPVLDQRRLEVHLPHQVTDRPDLNGHDDLEEHPFLASLDPLRAV